MGIYIKVVGRHAVLLDIAASQPTALRYHNQSLLDFGALLRY